jgi:hypothetical protein
MDFSKKQASLIISGFRAFVDERGYFTVRQNDTTLKIIGDGLDFVLEASTREDLLENHYAVRVWEETSAFLLKWSSNTEKFDSWLPVIYDNMLAEMSGTKTYVRKDYNPEIIQLNLESIWYVEEFIDIFYDHNVLAIEEPDEGKLRFDLMGEEYFLTVTNHLDEESWLYLELAGPHTGSFVIPKSTNRDNIVSKLLSSCKLGNFSSLLDICRVGKMS